MGVAGGEVVAVLGVVPGGRFGGCVGGLVEGGDGGEGVVLVGAVELVTWVFLVSWCFRCLRSTLTAGREGWT